MLKAIVIGSPGAGKSTFSRKLRDVTGLPLYYLDMLWHRADKTTTTTEEFDRQLGELMKKEEWIIDGNYNRTLEWRFKECDTVFLLDYPLEICLLGAQSRVGTKREDLPWIEEEFDADFKDWIIDFSKDNLPYIYRLIDIYKKEREIIIFKSRQEAQLYLQILKKK